MLDGTSMIASISIKSPCTFHGLHLAFCAVKLLLQEDNMPKRT